jgi:5-methylcytosine-specific restriction endonuclease McrA
MCGAPAIVPDHVIPLSAGGTDDESNLQALCKPCHDRKTVLCDGGLGRRSVVLVAA